MDAKDFSVDYSNPALMSEYYCNINLHPNEVVSIEDPPGKPKFILTANIEQVIREKKSQISEHSFTSLNGELQYFEVHGFPVLNKMGDVEKIIEYSFDITGRKKADNKYNDLQKQLFRSERLAAIGKLSASVAHEINNPLQAIIDNIDYVEYSLDKNFPETNSLQQIKIGVDRITYTVKQLLNINRPKVDAQERVSVNETLISTLDLLRNQFMIKKIEIQKELCDGNTEISAIPQELFQVFLNIFLNAIEAMKNGGKLSVATFLSEGEIVTRIEDTGTGISDEIKDSIFEPFFTTKAELLGMGLGLTTAKSIINSFNGAIDLESQVGIGTTIQIRFFSIEEVE